MSHEPTVFSPKRWIKGVLLGLDLFAATLIGIAPRETISSSAGRAARAKHWWGRMLCKALDTVDPGHCKDSVEANRRFKDDL